MDAGWIFAGTVSAFPGDATPSSRRRRHRRSPPDYEWTTPRTTDFLHRVFWPLTTPSRLARVAAAQRRLRFADVFLVASLVVCGGGCVSPAVVREVRVTARLQQPPVAPGSFRVISRPATPDDAKTTQEAIAVVRRGLVGKGYRESTEANGADLVLTVSCGIGGASIQRATVREPIYRWVQPPAHYESVQAGTSPNGTPIFERRLVESPAYQKLAGHREVPVETKIFKKYLRLKAHAKQVAGGPSALVDGWAIESVCEEAGASVSEIIPVLTAACLVYVGKQTTGAEVIRMSDADKDVAALRRSN